MSIIKDNKTSCQNCKLFQHEFDKAKNNILGRLRRQLKETEFLLNKYQTEKKLVELKDKNYPIRCYLKSIEDIKKQIDEVKNTNISNFSNIEIFSKEIKILQNQLKCNCGYCPYFSKYKPRKATAVNLLKLHYQLKEFEFQLHTILNAKFLDKKCIKTIIQIPINKIIEKQEEIKAFTTKDRNKKT